MRSPGSDRNTPRNQQPVAVSASIFNGVVIALIGAGATVGAAFLVYELQARDHVCSDLKSDYDKADDINDSAKKLKRLRNLLSANKIERCSNYTIVKQAEEDLEKKFENSLTHGGDDTDLLSGRTVRDADTITAGAFAPDVRKTDSPISRDSTPPQVASIPKPLPSTGLTPSAMEALASNNAPAQIEFSPQPETPAVLTVTPQSNPSFEGQVGDKLVLRRDVSYSLRPQQYYTTYYGVSGGDVVVSVDGKPHFHCKQGNTFRLYWQNIPDFFAVTHGRLATLTVLDAESGAHLGISDCEPAAG